MKRYVGGEFILGATDRALLITPNNESGTFEEFTWEELEKDGICCRPSGECGYTYDSSHDMYETFCGEAFFFDAGKVEENEIQFCPFCGKKAYEKDFEEIE